MGVSFRPFARDAIHAFQRTRAYRGLRTFAARIPIHEASDPELETLRWRYGGGDWKGAPPYVQIVASSRHLIFGDVVFASQRLHGPESDAREAWLYRLAVRSWCRRLGIGDRLVCAVLERARLEGFAIVSLEVNRRNTPAIALYRRHGFAFVSDLRMVAMLSSALD